MKANESNTMWPEKINAIYTQFPWLENIHPQAQCDRAYVRRVDEGTLDLYSSASVHNSREIFQPTTFTRIISIFLVDDSSLRFREIGELVTANDTWLGCILGLREVTYLKRTVRDAILAHLEPFMANHVVMLGHAQKNHYDDLGLNQLTVFKPPQQGVTLWGWYKDKVSAINKAVAEEVANA